MNTNDKHGTSPGKTRTTAFGQRMAAQCRQIDRYWLVENRMRLRRLRREDAALEWIEQHAEEFARNYD